MSEQSGQPSLKRVLRPIHLWSLAVGLVISGEYFGWNYGWKTAGTYGFLVATIVVTIMYICFIFSYTELSVRIPHAGGPFAYAQRAFGPLGGAIAGFATLVEFLFAAPAIAFALGAYVHFLFPELSVLGTAIGSYLFFTLINLIGIRESALFNLVITVLAILELLLFIGVLAPHAEWRNFAAHNENLSFSGIFAAFPFAIWLYLAIEGAAMVAEEVKNPRKNIPIGFGWGMFTLIVLALSVMFVAGSVGDWRTLSDIDFPLPESIGMVHGKNNSLTQLFAGIGLFGIIASLHGAITAYSRQLFALSRGGYLPGFLSKVSQRFRTPHWSLIAGAVIGILTILTGTTDQVIILSALGAVTMYAVSMFAFFRLRKKEGVANTEYQTPAYPVFPLIALVLSLVSVVAMIWFTPHLALWFFVGGLIIVMLFWFTGMHKRIREVVTTAEE